MWLVIAEVCISCLHSQVFGGKLYPTNEVKTYKDLKEYLKVLMGNGRKWVHGFSVQVFGAWILYSIVQKPGLLEKADEMLPAIQGTLVPLQFRFLEGDLENLRKPTSPSDVRFIFRR